ncbi:MAG: ATP-binding cassette domain-containing protein, partial [Leptolyngbyaceae cyanobacterium SM1_3_5]|nr:ATP-binding cassette domain-containing protein [Leptolyngbyaceae cyanobacterium SM1_3_5]
VIQQELSIGQLLAFTTLNRNVTGLMNELVNLIDDWVRVKTANARLQEVVMTPPEIQPDDRKSWVNLTGDSSIVCQHLCFHYPGRTELLNDFSVDIPGGQTIALIGKSGCGKSTLAKLISSLYFPQSGNIRLGNYNLSDLSLECIRQQVVLVPQDAHFWSRSILENFRMGNPHLSFEQIIQACQTTGADDFISQLPDKYQTILGEFGATLSGGQRQRLAIARAIANDPPLLILDESTAGLDPVSEAQLLDKLLWQRRGKTTILISHRPPVIAQADWIVFLDRGQFVRQGTLSDLQATLGEHSDFLTL